MYKKITCAFCCVISIFIIVAILYLLFTETNLFSEKSPPIEVPKISIFLVNSNTRVEHVYHETPNSDLVIDFLKLNLTDGPSPQVGSSEYSQTSRKNILRIRCHSNYPVQLKYIGFGNISDAKNRVKRQIENFKDRGTYRFTTELDFVTVDEAITGKYECQVRDDNLVKASVFIYIFASGSKSFVSRSPHELIYEPDSLIEIPCPVSSPERIVSLRMEIPLIEKSMEKPVEPEQVHHFDPKVGFILKPNNFGIFRCLNERTNETSGRISVFMPLSKVVHGKTLRIYSQNVDPSDKSLKLACRAKEPVRLKFINFIKFFKQPREIKNDSHEFPHGVKIKLNKEWFRGNMSVIECETVQTRRIVKTWKFLNQDIPVSEEENFSNPQLYLQHTKKPSTITNGGGYQCCSFQQTMRPVLRTYPCNTPMECELRSPCLSIDPLKSRSSDEATCPLLNAANDAVYEGDPGCTMLRTGKDQSGIIRCSLDQNMRDYLYFTGNGTDGVYASAGAIQANKKKVDPSSILHLNLNKESRSSVIVSKGYPVRFDCTGSKLYLAAGFQWALERPNEPIKYLTNKGSKVETDSPLHHEWIIVPITDQSHKRIYCIAPLVNPPLYGHQWINVSLSFK